METDIMERNSKGEVVKLGTVRLEGGRVVFEGVGGGMEAWLRDGIVVWEEDERVVLRPEDGARYVEALPIFLHGDRLWATSVRA